MQGVVYIRWDECKRPRWQGFVGIFNSQSTEKPVAQVIELYIQEPISIQNKLFCNSRKRKQRQCTYKKNTS
jgi:hypothetical protein